LQASVKLLKGPLRFAEGEDNMQATHCITKFLLMLQALLATLPRHRWSCAAFRLWKHHSLLARTMMTK
jgi:hypothetical protein